MSGSNNVGGKGAGVIGVGGVAVLPFTGNYPIAMFVVITALVCAGIVLLSVGVRSLLTR